MIEMLYGNFSHFAVEAILFVASVLNWNDKYLPSQTPYTDEYDFESSCCLSKARYDYIYKCKVEEERYRTNGATYRWCRAGRKASKYIKKHAQEIKIPVLLCQAGKDYLVSNAAEDEFMRNCLRALRRSILIQSTRYLMRMMIPWRSFTQISLIFGLEHENEIRQVKNVT